MKRYVLLLTIAGCKVENAGLPTETSQSTPVLSSGAAAAGCDCTSGFVNVKSWCNAGSPFNAAGNGVTDDAPVIQAALDCLDVSTTDNKGATGTVFLPAGIYRLEATLQLPTTTGFMGVGLLGESQSSTALLNKTSGGPALIAGSPNAETSRASRFEIGHLAVIGDWDTNDNKVPNDPMEALGILVYKGQYSSIHDVAVFSAGGGLKFSGYLWGTLDRVHYWPHWGHDIYPDFVPSWPTVNPFIHGLASSPAFEFTSETDAILDVVLRDCIANHGTSGYLFRKTAAYQALSNIAIRGGLIQNINGDAITITSPSPATAHDIELTGIHIEGLVGAGRRAINATGADYLHISNMAVVGPYGAHGVILDKVQRATISNSSGFGILDLVSTTNAASTWLSITNSMFSGLNPSDALDYVEEKSIMGSSVVGVPHRYGIRTRGEVVAQRVVAGGVDLGKASGVFRAVPTQSQEILAGTSQRTVLNFTPESGYDPGQNFSNNQFIAPHKGFYQLNTSVTMKDLDAGTWFKIFLYKNGGGLRGLLWETAPSNLARKTYFASTIVQADAGDAFTIQVTHSASTSEYTDNDYGTYFEGVFLGIP